MHLLEVRISGFKTFVDYTKIKINQDLVCVVGPNGCGKSNILDAIRWVLGESSNKLIRTNINDDVIFNGAKGRARSDRASVELIFDNSDKKITGQFEKFNQISIKRELFRDEPSKFSINQQRVRRKDVVNIFMGTGLGGNSYALIQQGLVSQMVESKPDELREMIEEAAQISGYKQRRHETSLKIKNTLENLDRVNDLKSEISEQCRYLNNQAKAAKRFHKLKNELLEKRFKSVAFEYEYLANKKKYCQSKALELEAQIERINAKITQKETANVQCKEKIANLNQSRNEIEKIRYEKGKEIARLEERIKQIEEDLSTKEQRIGQFKGQINQFKTKLSEQIANQSELDDGIEKISLKIEKKNQEFISYKNEFEEIEKNRQSYLLKIANAESKKNNLDSHLSNQQMSISQFNQTLNQQNEQLNKITSEIKTIDLTGLQSRLKETKLEIEKRETTLNQIKEKQQKITTKFTQTKEKQQSGEKQLADLNKQKVEVATKINAVEQMIISLEGEKLNQSKKQLTNAQIKYALFSDKVKINPDYQSLIGAILPEITAISLDEKDEKLAIQWLGEKLAAKEKIELEWFVLNKKSANLSDSQNTNSLDLPLLSDFFKGEGVNLPQKLNLKLSQIFVCKDLKTALSKRDLLANNQSILTHQGVWLSMDWLKVIDVKAQSSNNPALVRERLKKDQLKSQSIQSQIVELKEKLVVLNQALQTLEIEKNDAGELVEIEQTVLNQKRQNLAHQQSEILWQSTRKQELAQAKINLLQSIESNQLELNKLKKWDNQVEKIAIENRLNDLKTKQSSIDEKLNLKKSAYEQCREQLQQKRQKLSNQQLQYQFITETIERISKEKEEQELALEKLISDESQNQSVNKKSYQQQLDNLLNDHQKEDKKIADLNQQISEQSDSVAKLENKIKDNKEQYYKIDKQNNALEIEIEQISTSQRECMDDLIRLDKNQQAENHPFENQSISQPNEQADLEERLVNLGNEYLKTDQMIDSKDIEAIKDEVDWLEIKLGKMSSVNLNAIEDYQQAKKKLDYMVSQSDDIEQALNTLKQAIYKIDHQTKSMFEATFNQINQFFGEYFPALFGGGSAKLVLTENNMLTSGVIIDAKPYGKKNKQISMLSGGEKTLTAIALIFSFFSLNPAPFCLLDEVDAPLDDYNTQKFIELIKQKSSDVQFICITHNKLTMQSGSQLLGVTMNEPGVSRVVSVDVEKAMELTQ